MQRPTSRKRVHPHILIVDFGSQVSTLISRALRQLGFRSILLNPKRAEWWIQTNQPPRAIILSGGDRSVYEDGAPQIPESILNSGVPILGICYGMQLIAQALGGDVWADSDLKEYGEATLSLLHAASSSPLMKSLSPTSTVWMSHGDSVAVPPRGFQVLAKTHPSTVSSVNAVIERHDKDGYFAGVQFHPEVIQTAQGLVLLLNFVEGICRCEKDWKPRSAITKIRVEIRERVQDGLAVLGYSGGVDSSVVASLAAPVLGERLLGIVIDTGFLRRDELKEIRLHAKHCGIRIRVVRAHRAFERALAGHMDAEAKRAAFKRLYREILEREARRFGARYIIQGTLATDLIESAAKAGAAHIKSHHNVGLRFEGMRQLQPLRNHFKYEVRELADLLHLPSSIRNRQPFPGPGLSIRIVGLPATEENARRLQDADALVRQIMMKAGVYDWTSQLIVALVGQKTTGVKGDARVYGDSMVIRPFVSEDFMTGSTCIPGSEVIREVTRAVTALPNVVRCWWDFTEKPPATTELE